MMVNAATTAQTTTHGKRLDSAGMGEYSLRAGGLTRAHDVLELRGDFRPAARANLAAAALDRARERLAVRVAPAQPRDHGVGIPNRDDPAVALRRHEVVARAVRRGDER